MNIWSYVDLLLNVVMVCSGFNGFEISTDLAEDDNLVNGLEDAF